MDKNIKQLSKLFTSDTIIDLQDAFEDKNSTESKNFYIDFMFKKIETENKKEIYEKFISEQAEQVIKILESDKTAFEIQKSIQLLIQRELSPDNEKKITKVFTKKEVEEKKYQYYRKLKESIENSNYQSFEKLFKTEEIVYYYKEEYRYFPLEFNLTLELFNQLINARNDKNNASGIDKFENLLKILWTLLNNSYGSYLKTSIEHLKHLNQLYQSTLIPLNNRNNKEKFQLKSKQFQSELDELLDILNDSIFSNNNIKKCNIIIRKLIQICNLISNNKPFKKQTNFTTPNWVNAGDQFKVLFELIQNKIEIDSKDGKIKKITKYNNDNKQEYIQKLVDFYEAVLRDKKSNEYNRYLLSLKKLMPTTNRNNNFFVYYKFFSYLLTLILSLLNKEQIDNIPAQKILKLIVELLLENNEYIQDRYKYILKIDLIKKELRESVNTRIKLELNTGTKVFMENNNSEYTEYKKIFENKNMNRNQKLGKINGIELKKKLKSIHGYYLFSLDEEKYDYHSLHATFLKDWEKVKEIYDFLSNERFTYNIEKTIENISTRNLLKRKPLRLSQNETSEELRATEQLRNERTTSVIEEETAIQSPENTGNLKFSEQNNQATNTKPSQTLSESSTTKQATETAISKAKRLRNEKRSVLRERFTNKERNDITKRLRNEETTSVIEEKRATGGNKIKYFKGPRNGVYYMKGKKKIYV